MTTVFISHATADKYFVDLMVELLEYHHVKVWYDKQGIQLGKKYKDEISRGLASSDYLIVVVSENAKLSDWVKREITTFQTQKPDSEIIPVYLAPVPADSIFDGLKEYQSIFFYENMLSGYKKLLSFFGKEFLPAMEKRKGVDRRGNERREEDRRKSSVLQRLRYGLWKDYEDSSGKGKFDEFDVSILSLGDFSRALLGRTGGEHKKFELTKYDFSRKETGEKVEITVDLLQNILYEVIDELRQFPSVKVVYVTDILAEKLTKTFNIEPHDKRLNDRRVSNDRRT
jgi:hypothetical protein